MICRKIFKTQDKTLTIKSSVSRTLNNCLIYINNEEYCINQNDYIISLSTLEIKYIYGSSSDSIQKISKNKNNIHCILRQVHPTVWYVF